MRKYYKYAILSEIPYSYLKQRHQIFSDIIATRDKVLYIQTFYYNSLSLASFLRILWRRVLVASPLSRYQGASNTVNRSSNIDIINLFAFPRIRLFPIYLLNPLLLWFQFRLVHRISVNFSLFYSPTYYSYLVLNYLNSKFIAWDNVHDYSAHPSYPIDLLRRDLTWLLPITDFYLCDNPINYRNLPAVDTYIKSFTVIDRVVSTTYLNKTRDLLLDNYCSWQHNLTQRINTSDPLKMIYFGNIRSDLDFQLLRRLSREFDIDFYGKISECPSFFSDYLYSKFKGFVPESELPDLLSFYDIIVLPYSNKTYSSNIVPAKIMQCILSGKVVLCSGFSIPPSLSDIKNLFYLNDQASLSDIFTMIESYSCMKLSPDYFLSLFSSQDPVDLHELIWGKASSVPLIM